MDLSKLITSMMQIVMQNTGAQNGIFLVPDASGGFVLFIFTLSNYLGALSHNYNKSEFFENS
jgi:hypothetical protein